MGHRMEVRHLTALVFAALMLGACAGSGPSIKVIGLGEAQRLDSDGKLVVLVEVVNPSQTEVVLSKLKYRLECDAWAPVSGTLRLSRSVSPRSSEVFQIPVTAKDKSAGRKGVNGLGFELNGRLYAVDQSWKVSTKGRFRGSANAARVLKVRIASSQ